MSGANDHLRRILEHGCPVHANGRCFYCDRRLGWEYPGKWAEQHSDDCTYLLAMRFADQAQNEGEVMADESKLGVEPGKYPSTQTRNTDPGTIQAASFREAKLAAENRDKPDTQKWGGRQS